MSRCDCYACQRTGHSPHDRYHPNRLVNDCVTSMMLDMTRNPWSNRADQPCASIDDIVATVARIYGKRVANRVYIELH
jgi:hypothetical protein